MSGSLAIAAVTATLRNLLEQGLNTDVSGTTVTTQPPDKARNSTSGNHVNLFLYHAMLNNTWRNTDIPWKVNPGETSYPPLPLNLYYLITVYYGDDENDIDTVTDANRLLGSHRLLGRVMSILHDHPVLDHADINAVLPPADQFEYLYHKVERIHITPNQLSLDEMSKLWAGLQTQYRMSTAYEASVVLIESSRKAKAALPVLRRGSEDEGVFVLPSTSPDLLELRMPHHKPAAELGDILTVSGHQLDSVGITVRFSHKLLTNSIEQLPVLGGTANNMQVKVPDTGDDAEVPSKWPPGFYTLSLVIQHSSLPPWITNALPFALSPKISNVNPTTATQGDLPLTLTLTCIPQIRQEQRVTLLFDNQEIPVQAVVTPADKMAPSTLTFVIEEADPGEYILRLRVDSVDSIPVDFSTMPPQFASNQKVAIT